MSAKVLVFPRNLRPNIPVIRISPAPLGTRVIVTPVRYIQQRVSYSVDRVVKQTNTITTPLESNTMQKATEAAAEFFARFISPKIAGHRLREFVICLQQLLAERLKHHWYPEKPTLGQAYRCIRLNSSNPREPLIDRALMASGLRNEDIKLPLELAIWIDPDEVVYRIGEDEGSLCTLVSFKGQASSNTKIVKVSQVRAFSQTRIVRQFHLQKPSGYFN